MVDLLAAIEVPLEQGDVEPDTINRKAPDIWRKLYDANSCLAAMWGREAMMAITKRLEATAFHEAGHAVVAWSQQIKVNSVSIIPDSETLSPRTCRSLLRGVKLDIDGSDQSRLRCERAITVCFSGPIAHKLICPQEFRRECAENDFNRAIDLVMQISTTNEIARAYSRLLMLQTEQLVVGFWGEISALATLLLEYETLTAQEVGNILSHSGRTTGLLSPKPH